MQIWAKSYGLQRGSGKMLVEDQPMLRNLSGGGIRLELIGRDASWVIELTESECEHIAEAIGREAPGSRPATCDD